MTHEQAQVGVFLVTLGMADSFQQRCEEAAVRPLGWPLQPF